MRTHPVCRDHQRPACHGRAPQRANQSRTIRTNRRMTMNNAIPNTFVDGNAPAGPLSEHLRGHRRSGRCANCERSSRMAETRVPRHARRRHPLPRLSMRVVKQFGPTVCIAVGVRRTSVEPGSPRRGCYRRFRAPGRLRPRAGTPGAPGKRAAAGRRAQDRSISRRKRCGEMRWMSPASTTRSVR